jgi:ribosomal protein S27AE
MGVMDDELLKKLDQRIDRRSFLRGSGLAAAVFVGAAAFPLTAGAQDPQRRDETRDNDKDEKAEAKTDAKDGKKEDRKDGDNAEADPFKEIKHDTQGREYRMCPQCGYNMYRQDRTWTCENCGYSYVE